MKNKTELHFFCGKMAAGKSTLAQKITKKIELENKAILIIEDAWLTQLYPTEITSIQTYIEYSERLKILLSNHVINLLSQSINVILDFPANTINQRIWFQNIVKQAAVAHTLHYLDVSDSMCKNQLKQRSKNLPTGTAFTTEAEFEEITQYFQKPEDSEEFNIVTYNR